jgi:antitoxin component YwqK of YwqJK toxin-antitoxin module
MFLVVTFFVSCSNHKDDGTSKPLVLRNGLYYADSTSQVPFTGRNKSNMMGQEIEYDVVNGVREGIFITYYSNKNIQMIGKLSNNKNVGEWKYYFPDGKLETTGFFENDVPAGKWTWYNQNGKMIEEGYLINGQRDGEWKSYDSTGRLDILRTYKADNLLDSIKVN